MARLYLHHREVQSVFNLLGEKENDITFSMGWALSRSPSFLRRFLGCVLGASAVGQGEPTILLQDFKHGAGITDIDIRSVDFHLVVEAKRGWNLPSEKQLKKYVSRFRETEAKQRLIVTMSECSTEYARLNLTAKVNGIRVRHISWSNMSSLSMLNKGTQAEKRLMQEFRYYISTIVNMQPQESNWVYVVALNYDEWVPGLTTIQLVEQRNRYFHPYGWDRFPSEPPNYIGFRYKGKLQSIHHIENSEVIKRGHPFFPREYPNKKAKWGPYFLYKLGPPIRPEPKAKTGNIYRGAHVWAMLDLLLTSKTIAEARDASEKRAEQI